MIAKRGGSIPPRIVDIFEVRNEKVCNEFNVWPFVKNRLYSCPKCGRQLLARRIGKTQGGTVNHHETVIDIFKDISVAAGSVTGVDE